MDTSETYTESTLTRSDVDSAAAPLVLEFGAPWCGICAAAKPAIDAAFAPHPALRRVKVWDGPGKPLGRSFGIKLWPTLVFIRDGREIARLVRPTESPPVLNAIGRLSTA